VITTRLSPQANFEALPHEIETEVESLCRHLGRISRKEVLTHKSRSLKRSLADYSPKVLQEISGSIKPETEGRPPANLRLDKVLSTKDGTQFLNIELCLNNKEAAGTNYLKMSSAAKFQLKKGAEFSLGLLLVPTRELLELGGWDSVYGDSSEYSHYFKEGYQESLFGRFLIIELSSAFLQ
jgi:hypothetical protein